MTFSAKHLLMTAACSSLALGAFASADPAQAQFRGLRDAVRKVEDAAKTANDAADAVTGTRPSSPGSTSASPRSAPRRANAGGAAPAPSKYLSQMSCANLGLGDAFVGRYGDYTFSQGLSTQKRGGIIDRRPVKATDGCMFEGLGVNDVLYVEFDASRFKRGDYRIQCVSYDGSEQLDNVGGPMPGNSGRAVMLHTGNSLGYTPTASGSNSDRGRAYTKYLDGRGRAMATFSFPRDPNDKGTDFFCQWYNVESGKSAIGMTFRRGPAG
jgi:hypothetical protein